MGAWRKDGGKGPDSGTGDGVGFLLLLKIIKFCIDVYLILNIFLIK